MANRRRHKVYNTRVRDYMYDKRVYQYELASELGISVSNLLIKFRSEQPPEIQERWIKAIDKIAEQNETN